MTNMKTIFDRGCGLVCYRDGRPASESDNNIKMSINADLKKAIILLLLALFAGASQGMGSSDCWRLKEREPFSEGWLLGYLSGLNSGMWKENKQTEPVMKVDNGQEVVQRMVNYCKANPRTDFEREAKRLFFSADSQANTDFGDLGCQNWLDNRHWYSSGSKGSQYNTGWTMGYLSGRVNMWKDEQIDPLAEFRHEVSYQWIDHYCEANPQTNLMQAAEDLFVELVRKAGQECAEE